MPQDDQANRTLKHKLANAEAKTRAAQSMLKHAADEIDELIDTDCEDEQKDKASETANRLRRAASS